MLYHGSPVIVQVVSLVWFLTVISLVSAQTDLTFAESVYVKISDACRAIMDLQYNSLADKDDLIKTMKIIYISGNNMRIYPISEAYKALTQPSVFDITKKTKVIIHGFKDNSQSAVPMELAEAYDDKKMFNVILVDAEQLINKWYIVSVHNARLVGKRLANLLANLENFGASADDFHLLGISLGAHIAGWAGKYFRQYKKRNIGRITGLDPAGPCFTYALSDQRLDSTDAEYVDVIHSNKMVQGVIEPLGHADFYINGGGPNQPGCFSPSCSHLRAAQAYIESIKSPKSLIGIKCQSWKQFVSNTCEVDSYAVLGYGSSTATRGLYYLRTATDPPLGLGMKGTTGVSSTTYSNWLRTLNLP